MDFNKRAKNFSKKNLASLAYCANLAYEKKEDISDALTEMKFDVSNDSFFFSNSDSDTQAFVVGDNHKIIISFRGTEGKIADWVTDLRVFKETWTEENPLGEVHNGFYYALSSIWDGVYQETLRLRTKNQSIWITGHSLGGALAALAGATFELQNPSLNINGVYTFGQPRIGNHSFAKRYNEKLNDITFRCVNNNDVVTRIPPQIFGYRHVGKLMYFDTEGKIHHDKSLSWWARFWDRAEGRFDDVFNLSPDGIGDHSIDKYQKLAERQR